MKPKKQEKEFAVIFDMDGVLIDSTKHIWGSFNVMIEHLNFRFDESHIRKYLGNSLRDQAEMWKKDHGIDVGDVKEFSAKANRVQMESMKENLKSDTELLRVLEELKKKNIPMAVGTSSQRPRTEQMLSVFGLTKYFSALVTASDVAEHKPNPHVFLEAAERLGVSPQNCVVIEDAASGIEAAKNGGMKAIGLLTEWNSKEELQHADMIIASFHELSYLSLQKLFL